MFKRKVYEQLLEWKNKYSDRYAVLLEGARRVGKSTIAKEFAKREYASYILIDSANITDEMQHVFDDIANLDIFFLRLQAEMFCFIACNREKMKNCYTIYWILRRSFHAIKLLNRVLHCHKGRISRCINFT